MQCTHYPVNSLNHLNWTLWHCSVFPSQGRNVPSENHHLNVVEGFVTEGRKSEEVGENESIPATATSLYVVVCSFVTVTFRSPEGEKQGRPEGLLRRPHCLLCCCYQKRSMSRQNWEEAERGGL